MSTTVPNPSLSAAARGETATNTMTPKQSGPRKRSLLEEDEEHGPFTLEEKNDDNDYTGDKQAAKKARTDQPGDSSAGVSRPLVVDGPLDDERKQLPIAPSLKAFLSRNGYLLYRPQPEWYAASQPVEIAASEAHTTEVARNSSVQEQAQQETAASIRRLLSSLGRAVDRGLTGANTGTPGGQEQPEANLTSPPETTDPLNDDKSPQDDSKTSDAIPLRPSQLVVFGKDWDHALHVAIREGATEAALVLIDHGVDLESKNAKHVTPLILAAQKGNLVLVEALLHRGADPCAVGITGVSAVLQASHFGHPQVLRMLLQHPKGARLVEKANYNNTTPLMRACQEGHYQNVQLLLAAGANVNRRNRAHLTALLLASQRGHARICKLLLKHQAELDARTPNHSTGLALACKRGHVDVVKVLVTAGCELSFKDPQGRTVRDLRWTQNRDQIMPLLDPVVQIDLMQRQRRQKRHWTMIKTWRLLSQRRANLLVPDQEPAVYVNEFERFLAPSPQLSMYPTGSPIRQLPYAYAQPSTQALLRTMTLPEPLVQSITQFLPLPHLWERQVGLLAKRAAVNANDSITQALDLVDEILEEGGLMTALDETGIAVPSGCNDGTSCRSTSTPWNTWTEWKAWARKNTRVQALPYEPRQTVTNIDLTTAQCPLPRTTSFTLTELRRHAEFLQYFRSGRLKNTLISPPFRMPPKLVAMLERIGDVASLVRRSGCKGITFDVSTAMDLVMLTSQLCMWYWRERDENWKTTMGTQAVAMVPVQQQMITQRPHIAAPRAGRPGER